MPIHTERAGIFRGRRDNRDAWYVVEGAEFGRDDRVQAWRENFAVTNRPRWQRVVKVGVVVAVGAICLLAVSAVGALAMTGITDAGIRAGVTFPIFFLALIVFVVALFAGGNLAAKIFPYGSPALRNVPGVHEIPNEVADWATDETDIDVISDLSRTLDRVRQSSMLLKFPADPIEGMDRSWVIEDVVTPVLEKQRDELASELVEVAQRVGFPIPDLDLPPSPAG